MKKRSTTRLYGFCVLFSLCYEVTRLGIIRRCFDVSDGRAANKITYNKRMEFNLINSITVQRVYLISALNNYSTNDLRFHPCTATFIDHFLRLRSLRTKVILLNINIFFNC